MELWRAESADYGPPNELQPLQEVLQLARQAKHFDEASDAIKVASLELKPLAVPIPRVPRLSYGLERALFK